MQMSPIIKWQKVFFNYNEEKFEQMPISTQPVINDFTIFLDILVINCSEKCT